MNIQNKYTSLGKSILSGAICAGVITASMSVQADVAQVPLGLSEGVSPNMLFTLDESGSMSWGYVPDADSSVAIRLTSQMDTQGNYDTYASVSSRRFYSHRTNPMYYNPHVIYEIPPAFYSDGTEYQLTTSFTKAPINGFRPSDGTTDLSNEYKAIYEHRMPVDDPKYADHPNYSNTHTAANGVTDVGRTYGKSSNAKAYYYEFDGTLVHTAGRGSTPAVMCSERRNDERLGGERCYRVRYVDETSAYNESGQRLKHADGKYVDGKQNFAIWYSFYKTRALATLSAASIAFYDLSSSIRFSWQDLATCRSFDGSDETHCKKNRLQPYSEKHRGQFYSWLRDVYFNVGTPLPAAMIRAGEFYKSDMPWRMYPQDPAVGEKNTRNTAKNTLACRPSYHVLMTDGMWNTRQTYKHVKSVKKGKVSWDGSYDKTEVSYPASNTDDSMPAPYGDTTKKTLADIAMHYWKTDLTTLPNKVPPYMPYKSAGDDDPRNNPATWQHMTNFIMGLGLTNSLNAPGIPWEGQTHAGAGYNGLKSGSVKWPVAGLSTTTNTDWWGNTTITENNGTGLDTNVYDLWHAAINSRGEFYSVDNPETMVQAFKDILTRIADRKSSAAMPGVSASLESDGAEEDAADRLATFFYQTTFDSGDGWTGNVQKVKKYRKYNKDTNTFEDIVEQGWSAKDKMPSADRRNIMIAGGGTSKLQSFSTTNAGNPDVAGSLAYYLNIDPESGTKTATWQQRLEYLRGSKTNEGDGDGKLRTRSSILGDFLTSQPVVVKNARYLEGFANRLESPAAPAAATTAYSDFMASIATRRGQLYIGGNDGMLHAFDTETGVEKFAFIPTAVFPKLNKLTGKNYSHEFYVDGTPVVADVYDGTKWRTILVGTLRAGGKGLFALDITDPDNIQLLWEFGENSITGNNAVKPGYSFPQPTVARLHNGQWAVVTGNGYKGEGTNNGAAALYVINAITGVMIQSLEVQSPNAAGGENGLSSPRLADYDSDGVADYAYAGDLHGNLWRFDLLGAGASAPTVTPPSNGSYGAKNSETTFSVSYGGEPMFTATSTTSATGSNNMQSITSAPSLVRHPTRKGYLVMFGTGKYFESGDKAGEKDRAQTLYGIWDMKTKAEATSADTVSRSKLQQQTITSATTGTGKTTKVDRDARIISNNAVEWYTGFDSTKPVNKRGWYLDLTLGGFDGEMMIENMRSLGSMLLLQTLVPNDDPCANGSTNWLYAINPATGGRTLHHAFDTQAADKTIVSAIKFGSEGGVSISSNEKGLTANGDGSGGGSGVPEPIYLDPSSLGRQSWRMVPDA